MSDKRRHPRIEFKVVVDVESESMLQKYLARNLSEGGIFLEVTEKTPKLGSILDLRFTIPGITKPLKIEGEVVYVHTFESFGADKEETKKGIGIRFKNLMPKDSAIISEYIAGKHVRIR